MPLVVGVAFLLPSTLTVTVGVTKHLGGVGRECVLEPLAKGRATRGSRDRRWPPDPARDDGRFDMLG
jgi:hypothetical protein